MNEDQRLLVVGLYINAALYLVGVFTVALLHGPRISWVYALLAAGLSYVSYFSQIAGMPRLLNIVLVGGSVGAGAAAGIMLLV